jgi:hypothetical protein
VSEREREKERVIWYKGIAIQGDIDAVIFNPIPATILKWFRLELLVGGMIFSLAQQWFGIV